MATRVVWRGELKLAMVRCRVALHDALKPDRGSTHHDLADSGRRSSLKADRGKPEGNRIARSSVPGTAEIRKGGDEPADENVEAGRRETRRVMEIEHFVEAASIDRLYWNAPYYLSPETQTAARSFSVILNAIEKSGQVGIGRFVIRQREQFCVVEPRGDVLLVTTLREEHEIRSVSEAVGAVRRLPQPQAEMLMIAEAIIGQISVSFRSGPEFRNGYRPMLTDLIESGDAWDLAGTPDNVVELAQALNATLDKGGPAGERAKRFVTAFARKNSRKSS